MRFCFIVEDEYRRQSMPMVIARHLSQSGHDVDLLEPTKTVTALWDLRRQLYDAYILKTVADGPGLCVLEAAEAAGIPTINNSRSIRLVRDKSLCTAYAYAHGLPVPHSYFVADPQLLRKIPRESYPLVVKPTNGSSGRGINLVDSPARSLRRPKYAERVSDRKSTRLNSSHSQISYAVFCLKKKKHSNMHHLQREHLAPSAHLSLAFFLPPLRARANHLLPPL